MLGSTPPIQQEPAGSRRCRRRAKASGSREGPEVESVPNAELAYHPLPRINHEAEPLLPDGVLVILLSTSDLVSSPNSR
jgi:hypothetical protein